MSLITMQIDPYIVLGIAPGSPLEAIRDAYRNKAKVHHPDTGGEEWAFRILVQAYEILSAERVAHATRAEFHPRPSSPPEAPWEPPPQAPPDPTWVPPPEPPPGPDDHAQRSGAETVRVGVQDVALDPDRVIAVEKLWVRYEAGRPWVLRDNLDEDRFLSCSLNIAWPDRKPSEPPREIAEAESILRELSDVFVELQTLSHAIASNFQIEDDYFSGWLSYQNMNLASLAFKQLHDTLHGHGFTLRSWTRDLLIPRDRQ